MNWNWSPFMVPLGAFVVAIVAIVSGVVNSANKQRIRAEQRMAMVGRGLSAADIDKLLGSGADNGKAVRDPLQSMTYIRRAALVMMSIGIGVVAFGLLLTWIVAQREVLTVAATGLIPLAIGVGLLIDYKLHKRDLSRFGLEVGAEK